MIGRFCSFSHKSWWSRPILPYVGITRAALLLLLVFSGGTTSMSLAHVADGFARYTNSWAVEVRGGKNAADELAREQGFVNVGEVRGRGERGAWCCCVNNILLTLIARTVNPVRFTIHAYCNKEARNVNLTLALLQGGEFEGHVPVRSE